MDTGAFLFSLGLLSVGIWLIVMISRDLKEKRREQSRLSMPSRRKPQAVPRISYGVPPAGKIVPQPAAAHISEALIVITEGHGPARSADPWESLNAGFVREMFEKFTRE